MDQIIGVVGITFTLLVLGLLIWQLGVTIIKLLSKANRVLITDFPKVVEKITHKGPIKVNVSVGSSEAALAQLMGKNPEGFNAKFVPGEDFLFEPFYNWVYSYFDKVEVNYIHIMSEIPDQYRGLIITAHKNKAVVYIHVQMANYPLKWDSLDPDWVKANEFYKFVDPTTGDEYFTVVQTCKMFTTVEEMPFKADLVHSQVQNYKLRYRQIEPSAEVYSIVRINTKERAILHLKKITTTALSPYYIKDIHLAYPNTKFISNGTIVNKPFEELLPEIADLIYGGENLYILGETGSGKTALSNYFKYYLCNLDKYNIEDFALVVCSGDDLLELLSTEGREILSGILDENPDKKIIFFVDDARHLLREANNFQILADMMEGTGHAMFNTSFVINGDLGIQSSKDIPSDLFRPGRGGFIIEINKLTSKQAWAKAEAIKKNEMESPKMAGKTFIEKKAFQIFGLHADNKDRPSINLCDVYSVFDNPKFYEGVEEKEEDIQLSIDREDPPQKLRPLAEHKKEITKPKRVWKKL